MSGRLFAAVVVAVMSLGFVGAHQLPRNRMLELSEQGKESAQWFTQKLDHFYNPNNATFQQRYWINDTLLTGDSRVAIIYINGEGPASPPDGLPEVAMMATEFKAAMVTLEHRYYGLSLPFANLTTRNLQWLSSAQALSDLANFQTWVDGQLAQQKGYQPLNNSLLAFDWIVIGGSYSGALTAWYRTKFPQLTVGGIASSGVVNAIVNFTAFDEQVAASAGQACADVLRKTNRQLEAEFAKGSPVKNMFGAEMLTDDGDWWYFIGDTMATSVQYGFKDSLCWTFMNASQNGSDLVQTFANYVNDWWTPNFGGPASYATSYQSDPACNISMNYRQWWYQKCTEFGYFQVAPPVGSIRSSEVNLEYHARHCKAIFGEALWPNTNWTNFYYGGQYPKATRVFFFNGSQDPWRHASVPFGYATNTDERSTVVTCENCGHCVDLAGCPLMGCASELSAAWNYTKQAVSGWLKDAEQERAH